MISDQEVIEIYSDQMMELRKRINFIQDIWNNHELYKFPEYFPIARVELAALNLRKILEIIVLANLVANIKEYSKRRDKFRTDWNASAIIKDLQKVNPEFFPIPIDAKSVKINGKDVKEIVSRQDRCLNQEDWKDAYQMASEIVHYRNPFNPQKFDFVDFQRRMINFGTLIIALLKHHQVTLYKGEKFMVSVWHPFPKVHSAMFGRTQNLF